MINKIHNAYRLFSDMSVLSAVKYIEIRMLKSMASSYCYNYPYWIQLETTNKCNLNCIMCARNDELNAKGYSKPRNMEMNEFTEIIDQIKSMKVLHLFGRGEPLMNDKITDMILYSKKIGIPFVSITTNGTLLDTRMVNHLIKSGLDRLVVSIDGPDDETYSLIRNFPLEKVVRNIKKITSISSIPVFVNSVLNSVNYESIHKMPALVRAIGARGLNVGIVTENKRVIHKGIGIKYKGENRDKHMKKLRDEARKNNIQLLIRPQRIKRCFAPSLRTFIDVNGNITPCCRLEDVILDNVFKKSFWCAWNGSKVRKWREDLANERIPESCLKVKCIENKYDE